MCPHILLSVRSLFTMIKNGNVQSYQHFLLEFDRNSARPQPSRNHTMEETRKKQVKKGQNINVENPNRENPGEPTDSEQNHDSKATTSSSTFANRRLQQIQVLYLSLSLCLSV